MGDGSITLLRTLDYETGSSYNLTVEASDDGFPSLKTTIPVSIRVIDVNDNPPMFINFDTQGLTISEVNTLSVVSY